MQINPENWRENNFGENFTIRNRETKSYEFKIDFFFQRLVLYLKYFKYGGHKTKYHLKFLITIKMNDKWIFRAKILVR